MGRKKLYILLLTAASFMMRANAQQTIQFSQYVFNGLALNPAYAGYKEEPTLNISSRIQWVGINDAPQTGTVSFDGLTNGSNKNVGLGLLATLDHLGPESNSSVYANYAYRLRLDAEDTKRLCFGISFGAIQYRIDGSKFNSTDAGDGSVPTAMESKITPDFRFGVYYYSSNVYFGASVFNLLASTIDNAIDNTPVIKPQRTLYLTAGTMLPLSEQMDFKPSIIIKEDFKGPTNIDLTGYIVLNKRVWLGTSYRTGASIWNKSNLQSGLDETDAAAAIAQFYINDHFRIGYSFDFTLGKLANYQNGSHELSLSISFPGKKQRVVSPRYF
jgi:type IX secretion system PorP/SprF family membrane protein